MKAKTKHIILQVLVNFCRFLLAFTFIFSGFVKLIDPFGSYYKFKEYFTAFHLSTYLPDNFPLMLGILLSVVEFCVGIYLFFGIRRKISSTVALLLMILMTPLTLYLAIANPVSDCGCFGDALKLTNWQTFGKNVVLLGASTLVFRNKEDIIRFISMKLEWVFSLFTLVLAFILSIHCLFYLPIIDFRPYKIGVNIPKAMSIPEDAKRAVYETTFVMEKNGKQKEFTLENYPDSTWTYVSTNSKLIEKGYEPPIHDFVVTDEKTGVDMTDSILYHKGYSFLMVMHRIEQADDSNIDLINELYDYALEHHYPFYALTSSPQKEVDEWVDRTGAEYPILQMDEVTLKTMIRSNPGVILLHDGTIYNKWSNMQLPSEYQLKAPLEKLSIGNMKLTGTLCILSILLLWYLVPLVFVLGIDLIWIKRKERIKQI